ncbi:element excision factor XisH family protein [Rudanella lutea]|uniref:element excision factor XisH family protein n=1 Tax=Rudanella lutea TaxID=451374 RepID=UPI00039DDFEE|nr:element excision factor XisH family protein [Rudanella lutea]
MARDLYHEAAKKALIQDGWTITHDPLRIAIGRRQAYIDLGAKDLVGAERDGRTIAVEIKSFLNPSLLDDLYHAVGQYQLYRLALAEREPGTVLYLALPSTAWQIIDEDQISDFFSRLAIRVLIFDPLSNQVTKWIN